MATRHRVSEVDPVQKTGICSVCGPVRVYSNGTYRGDRRYRCSLPALSSAIQKYHDDPAAYRNARLLREYGITGEKYDEMLVEQGGACHRCQQSPTETLRLAVDHNHDTGAVRKLLCGPCNTYLGRLEANLGRLAADLTYLDTDLSRELAEVILERLATEPVAGW